MCKSERESERMNEKSKGYGRTRSLEEKKVFLIPSVLGAPNQLWNQLGVLSVGVTLTHFNMLFFGSAKT